MTSSLGDQQPGGKGEDDPVFSWRFDQLCLLGLDDAQAFLLARSELDLQLVRILIHQGCPVELAVKIAL